MLPALLRFARVARERPARQAIKQETGRVITLYAATSNPGKLRDFAVAAEEEQNALIQPLPGLDSITPPPEDEPTFDANARTKAIYYSRFLPDAMVIADDSGLEVDALDGEPGVRSARYAADAGFVAEEHTTTDQRNNRYLLTRLQQVPSGQRTARYRCVIAAARDGECVLAAEGVVSGEILTSPRGQGGFGYDPLFYLSELGKTMAEIDLAMKHHLSHRGRALRALLLAMPAI
jgi:XTP/dITP diphosphohydrolase